MEYHHEPAAGANAAEQRFRVIMAAAAVISLATLCNGRRMLAYDHGRDPWAGSDRTTLEESALLGATRGGVL